MTADLLSSGGGDDMTAWSELLSSALVGTDRRPAPARPPRGIDLPPGDRGPGRLLDLAAAATLTRRAGLAPARVDAVPAAAPDETLPPVPPIAANRLRWLLAWPEHGFATDSDLLAEWLGLARERSLRVPGSLLPDLLATAERRRELRPLVAAVGGGRVRWLAGLRPDWAWVRGESAGLDDVLWLDGDVEERVAYLTALRETDPDRARELLVEVWPQEPPAERASLLAVLAIGLGPADEGFCEAALDDRRREVRWAAAALLAVLPGSAYQRRMIARSRQCVSDNGEELVVTPPSTFEEAMRRDGIVEKPTPGTGERAWWFEQVISRTPLSSWDAEPAALLARPVADEWHATLHRGWSHAAVRHRDAAWAHALVQTGFGRGGRRVSGYDTTLLRSLYEQLDPADSTALAVTMLDGHDPHVDYVLPRCPRPWPPELAAAVMARLQTPVARSGRGLAGICAQAAAGMSPAFAAEVRRLAEAGHAEHPGDTRNELVDRLADTLTARHEMHQEFA